MTHHGFTLRQLGGSQAHRAIDILEVTGEIDADNAGELDRALRGSTTSAPKLVDLSAVAFFDSAGFAVLHRRLAERAILLVISPDSLVRRAASLIGVPFHDTVDDALAALADA